ncbi:MAG: SdiA-regulated domain-containing protein [Bacteroidia bacterium]|nr:SdiA-regulated domain-containing protein [Bacteroidia bacterium]
MINLNKNSRRQFLFIYFLKIGFIIALFMVLLAGCHRKVEALKSPPHYDFSVQEISKLDIRLREISGISWETIGNRFLAINDEAGKLYVINKESKAIDSIYTFGGKGDYEDVAAANGVPYILRSDGMITRFDLDASGKATGTEVATLKIKGSEDFESLYFDPGRKALIMLCKNCAIDGKDKINAYAYYLDSIGLDSQPVYQIDVEEAKRLAPRKSSKLQPSAAAINPQQQKLYILSSASNQLAIADLNGKVEAMFVLSKRLFPQPEGICFRANGDMYISNEGGNGKATLLKFPYRP